MKCAQCNYVLDFFDTSCPGCKNAVSARSTAISANAPVRAATPSNTSASDKLSHSPIELRRYLTKYWLQGALIGAGIGFLCALPLGLSLNAYRLAALAVRFKSQNSGVFYSARMAIGDGPLLVATALPLLALAIFMGWWIGRYWEETASAHLHTKGTLTTQAKLFGILIAGVAACFFIAWQHLHATIISVPHWIREPEYYYWSSVPRIGPNELLVVRSLTVVVMLTGAAVGLFVGRMIGRQLYEQARLRGFKQVHRAAQATTRGVGIAVNWGVWLVGAISLIMPCVGVLLYMAYSKDEDERATAAAVGVALALVLIGMRTFFRLSGQPVVD